MPHAAIQLERNAFGQLVLIDDTGAAHPVTPVRSFPIAAPTEGIGLVSPDGDDGSVTIHQDARMYAGLFDGDGSAELAIAPGRLAYVHLVRGTATVNGRDLGAGDALLYRDEPDVRIERGQGAEVLVFDLPELARH